MANELFDFYLIRKVKQSNFVGETRNCAKSARIYYLRIVSLQIIGCEQLHIFSLDKKFFTNIS
jgi:hypothetical protein